MADVGSGSAAGTSNGQRNNSSRRGGRGRGRGGSGRGGNRNSDTQADNSNDNGENDTGGSSNNRRRGGRGRGGYNDKSAEARVAQKDPILRATQQNGIDSTEKTDDADDDAEVCFICANPVIHHAIAPCNHLTCHICALRMRALYRTKDCPHCRTPTPYVIFTDDPAKKYEEYDLTKDITSVDDNIGIRYTNENIVGDTVLLLRYNCPNDVCDYAGLGWLDLHRHVKATHHQRMCDLCTRNKKVFTHEHELFGDKQLETHMRQGNDRPGAKDQSGFRGHPLCAFCGERFYDDDKLYEHCRNKHERCFICDRRDSRQPHYFRNYNELEKHFRVDHYFCMDRECVEKKFVVFESEMDLKAHQLAEHGNSLSKDVRRDVQVVSMADFNYRPSASGSGSGRNGGGRQTRGRDPNADAPAPITPSQNLRRDEIAYQRQLNIQSAQNVTSRTFGSQLSAPAPAQSSTSASGSRPGRNAQSSASSSRPSGSTSALVSSVVNPMETLSVQEISQMSPQDRARVVRHGAVIERASNMLGSNPTKIAAFRASISKYQQGGSTASQLIDALTTLFSDTSDTAVGSLVREVADLFEDKAKADGLRIALNNRRAATEDYPSLPTLGGMHGATTSTSGWAEAASSSQSAAGSSSMQSAQRQSAPRVLRLKNSTRLGVSDNSQSATLAAANAPRGSIGPSGRAVPGATWTAPASSRPATLTAASYSLNSGTGSAAFPALPSGPSAPSSKKSPSGWSGTNSMASSLAARVGGSSVSARPPVPSYATPASSSMASTVRAQPGQDNFPALPAAAKPPPPAILGHGRRTVRRDFGQPQETGFTWGGTSGDGAGPDVEVEEPIGKGKKKGKKVLVQWG